MRAWQQMPCLIVAGLWSPIYCGWKEAWKDLANFRRCHQAPTSAGLVVQPRASAMILQTQTERPTSIPKILHQVWCPSSHVYLEKCMDPTSSVVDFPRQACHHHHKHWEVLFWDMAAVAAFIEQFYPWFLATFKAYDADIKRADVARPFILHKLGGVYLDLDVQCLQPMDDSIVGFDAVLQGDDNEGVNNGMMATKPGLEMWMDVVHVLTERYMAAASDKDRWHQHPIYQTGPEVLANATARHVIPRFVPTETHGGKFRWHGDSVSIKPIGTWFMPCWIDDKDCRQKHEVADKDQHIAADVMGYHWFVGSWNNASFTAMGSGQNKSTGK